MFSPSNRHNVWLISAVFVLLGILMLSACNSRGTASTPDIINSGSSDIQIAVAANDFEVGQPRLPLVLYAGKKRGAEAQDVELVALDLSEDPPSQGWVGQATGYPDYWVPYWVAYPQLSHAGHWGFVAIVALADGSTTQAQFTIEVEEKSNSPALGSIPPASQNRTLETEPDIHKLSSDPDPNPGLYQMAVAEALKSGRPTVVTFATPAFCTSQLCAPVVDSVKAVYEQYRDQANFIHIEVYKTFEPLVYADEMAQWNLTSEPWTFVMDQNGKVVAKLSGPVSPSELTETLKHLFP